MSTQRNQVIEYLRGIGTLGVIGIHTGAYALDNPQMNIHLFAFLEIVTRFCVPIFFFISAFGLFYQFDQSKPFYYGKFVAQRFKSLVVPFWVWTAYYLWLYSYKYNINPWLDSEKVWKSFFLGQASYHMYFMVILIWFYFLMPLWRWIVCKVWSWPLHFLGMLLILQIGFNYYSSYMTMPKVEGYFFNLLIEYRQSYLVLHYLFIFLFGALWSARLDYFTALIMTHSRAIKAFFHMALAGMLGAYYYCIKIWGYRPDEAVNTVHQLNPIGVLYTLAATMYFYLILTKSPEASKTKRILGILGYYSFTIYLIHPTVMYFIEKFFIIDRLVMDVPIALLFYIAVVLLSLGFSYLLEKVVLGVPGVGILVGVKRKKRK